MSWKPKNFGEDQGWFSPAGSGVPTLVYVGNASGTASHTGSTTTFTNANIGSAAGFTTRRVLFGLTSDSLGPASISGVLINGSIVATVHVQQQNGGGGPFAAIFSADIPTGSTATIVITWASGVFNNQQLAVWTVDDATLLSTTPSVGSGAPASGTSAATSSFTQGAGGFTIAAAGLAAAVTTLAFTGLTTNQFGGSNNQIDASLFPTVSSGSTTATATWATSTTAAVVAASWR